MCYLIAKERNAHGCIALKLPTVSISLILNMH